MSFTTRIRWTGNTGAGTAHYHAYTRDWEVAVPGKPVIPCSNDPAIGGNPGLMNPEDMLLSALAGCHMLWFLHLASEAGIVVTDYVDTPVAEAEGRPGGAQRFAAVTLMPRITVRPGADLDRARAIHGQIHAVCFIARSVNFPVSVAPDFVVAG